MLQKKTVDTPTLELLTRLMNDSLLSDFFLVGGTALALQIGHRKSIDIDLFALKDFDEDALLNEIENNYNFHLDYQSKNTLKGSVDGIKVDFIAHKYLQLNPLIVESGVRMSSLLDIAAMKLNAIAGNGTRLKDFIDIAHLSECFTLNEMAGAYQQKYSTRNPLIAIKALGYYSDIDFTEPIEVIDYKYSWRLIEKRLDSLLKLPDKLLGPLKI